MLIKKIFLAFISIFLISNLYATDKIFIDKLVVKKSERRLYLYKEGKMIKEYPVMLGKTPVGPKRQQGDGKTPEGKYIIDWKNDNSDYYLSLHVSYPNAYDLAYAKTNDIDPGGAIMIHGMPGTLQRARELFSGPDWTQGCIAISNKHMRELWKLVKENTPITISP
jgi:murein L,D-transpeptidase YafK